MRSLTDPAGDVSPVQVRALPALALMALVLAPAGAFAQNTKMEDAAPARGGEGEEMGETGSETNAAPGEDEWLPGEDEWLPSEDEWLPSEVSGSVALTSNYVDRGLTNTSNDPAIQGSLDYAVPTGLGDTKGYVGFWSSNVDLEGHRDTANLEIDAFFGLRGGIGDVEWDVGGTYLYYPSTRSADNFNYWEIPVVLTYQATDRLGFDLTNLFAWENQFNTGLANYTTGNVYYDIPVPYVGLQLFAGVGYQHIEDDYNGTDWRAGATVSVKGVDFAVAYTDTNYRARDIGNNQGDAKIVFTIGAEF